MAFLTDESGSFAFVKLLKELMGGGGDDNLMQAVQSLAQFIRDQWFPIALPPTVPTNLSWLSVGSIPVWLPGREIGNENANARKLRSAMFMMSNTSSEDKTIAASTVFATGLEKLNANETYACMIAKADGSITENTMKAVSNASLAFTADQLFPANSTVYVTIEEN